MVQVDNEVADLGLVQVDYTELADLLDDVITQLKSEREQWGGEGGENTEDLTGLIARTEAFWQKAIEKKAPEWQARNKYDELMKKPCGQMTQEEFNWVIAENRRRQSVPQPDGSVTG